MCVAAIAWNAHPDWPLIAYGNRDELHARPAVPLARWTDGGIIAGRDARSGGTWLGVSEAGQFALVTNLRTDAAPDPAARSRGQLVTDCLSGAREAALAATYNPFNLFTGTIGADGWLVANSADSPEPHRRPAEPGIHGLSNGPLDATWPKTALLQDALAAWFARGHTDLEPLMAALGPDSVAPADGGDGANNAAPAAAYRRTPFILDPRYGTRCSTVCAVAADGTGRIAERRFAPDGTATGQTEIAFTLSG